MSLEALKDVAERAVRTFIQAFLAMYASVVVGADSLGGLLDLSVADKASAAGVAAALSVIMGVFGARVGSSGENASVR
jgi:hypothetical protein